MSIAEATVQELISKMTLEEKIDLTIGKDFWSTNGVERLGIEPITLNDGPHGVRKPGATTEIGIGSSYPATCFPTAVTLGCSWDTALVEEVGEALGEECLALDVQVLLGPGVNIKRTPLGGRSFEYYSEDPILAGEMGCAYVNGVQSKGIGTSLKHYACNNQESERMSISAEVDQRTLREIYLPAFERVVRKARPWTVMCSYNRVNGIYASEHRQLLHDILKKEWSFEGVIVSDWGAINEKAKALEAGLDLQMPGYPGDHTAKLAQMVKDGKLSESVIDEAASRILHMMLSGRENRQPGFTFDQETHHALARRAAAESFVLLKNSDNILPLQVEQLRSVAVIGRFAKEPRYQGAGSSQVIPTQVDSSYNELQRWLGNTVHITYTDGYDEGETSDDSLLHEAVEQAKSTDLALIFAGLPGFYESEGYDRTHLFMPYSHNRLIAEVCQVQPNTIVVLHNGGAVAMPWIDGPKAILEAGLGGQAVGSAIVDILSGKVNPCGKLAETFPVRIQDTPAYLNYPGEANTVYYGERLFVGYRYYDKKDIKPLFPFGYGLSYTRFEYTNLRINKTELNTGETLDVTVNIRNTGPRAGKEIIQLYIEPLTSILSRPYKELKAFAKVALEPGEAKDVHVTLEDRDFQIYDDERQIWRIDGGEYNILIGSSSESIVLSGQVKVNEDLRAMMPLFTRMSPIKQFLQYPDTHQLLTHALTGIPRAELFLGDNEMFTSMPVAKLVVHGILTDENIDTLIEQANQTFSL
ncbi:MAG TPA: glycoside hydrolase family 3 C-terminal domain-containing protein [Ktedonobacteraceae bacterium]|nr:glycoside hydrolase family 3 C-terminal domain-containing protein [Ktedonobacteraceae bacterium]